MNQPDQPKIDVSALLAAADAEQAKREADMPTEEDAVRAIIAELSARQEPVAWLVLDRNGYVMHAASWEQAAHDHINDAINEHDLKEAADWIVRPCYTTPPLPEAPDTVRVPPGYRLLKDSTEADRSWLGDALHENGRYSCCCCECGRMFIGHKRRVVCRVCSLEKDTP